MAINPFMRAALKALSYTEIDVVNNYRTERFIDNISHPSLKLRYKMWDHKIMVCGKELPVRAFSPKQARSQEVVLFFHGGGWVSGNIESYTKTCADMANIRSQVRWRIVTALHASSSCTVRRTNLPATGLS
jgi:hypothetical protein